MALAETQEREQITEQQLECSVCHRQLCLDYDAIKLKIELACPQCGAHSHPHLSQVRDDANY